MDTLFYTKTGNNGRMSEENVLLSLAKERDISLGLVSLKERKSKT